MGAGGASPPRPAGARLLGRRGGVRGHRCLDRPRSRPRTDGGGVRGRRPDRDPECGSAALPGGPPAAVHAGRRLSGRPRRGRPGPPGGRRRALGRRARRVIRRRPPRGPRHVGRESGDPDDHRCERRRRVHAQGHSAHREAAGRDRAHRCARHHLPRDRRAGAARAARRDARRERAVHGEPDLRPRPPAGRVGDGSVISDGSEPGRHPARLQRGHSGLSLGREGDRLDDGLLRARGLCRDRAAPRHRHRAARRRRGQPREPSLRRGGRDDPDREPHRGGEAGQPGLPSLPRERIQRDAGARPVRLGGRAGDHRGDPCSPARCSPPRSPRRDLSAHARRRCA